MIKTRTYATLALAGLMSWLTTAPVTAAPKTYETGFDSMNRISTDLYKALDKQKRGRLLSVPVLLEKQTMPYVEPSTYSDGSNVWQAVYVSAGLVDLLNCLSHARALEVKDRKAFSRYVAGLRLANGTLPEVEPVSNTEGWSFETMNHQASFFNQMAGGLMAVEMAHHYLGHYAKYQGKLKDAQGNPVPINSIVTPQEWHEAVLKGARNALDCGLSVEGLKLVLETLEQKETRPAWSVHFVPEQANLPKIKRALTSMEKDFFMIDR